MFGGDVKTFKVPRPVQYLSPGSMDVWIENMPYECGNQVHVRTIDRWVTRFKFGIKISMSERVGWMIIASTKEGADDPRQITFPPEFIS